jgi:hypothetical protein|tara:strand:+ start:69 stop:572 length:504 start_codon:yes stop_codon:yes gene_type:complete
MRKILLSEKSLYYGQVKMPINFEINSLDLSKSVFDSLYAGKDFLYSKEWDKLNTYLTEHLMVKFDLNLINKKTWADIYLPNEQSEPLLQIDPVDLKNAPDYVLLYGINTQDCNLKIHYDDNRRKGRSWDIPLPYNGFVMFPSTLMYEVKNKQKNSLNFIQTITYEYL